MSELRLNKALARSGVCSRRKADELIQSGRVTLNEQVVREPGIKVNPEKDSLQVNGRKIRLNQLFERDPVYVMLNKPVQVVTTMHDPQGRTKVADLLPENLKKLRLFPVGRLDYFSQGLLILTNDGDLAHRLTHPSTKVPKVYLVEVRGSLTRSKIRLLRGGMVLKEGERLAPVKVEVIKSLNDQTSLKMTLTQGLNRQIRRMCRDLDLTVLSLIRVRQGPVSLEGLKSGQWRMLKSSETRALRKSAGLEPAG